MKVAVVGGGFAGLCAATRLAGEGHHVILLEKRAHLGGSAFPHAAEPASPGSAGGPPPPVHLLGGQRRLEPAPRLLFGWYRAARAFFDRVGTAGKIHFQPRLQLTFVDRGGARPRKAALRATLPLPPPLDRLGALATFSSLSLLDRVLVLRVAAALRFPSRLLPAPAAGETVEGWLVRLGQSDRARRALWYPLAVTVLQDDPRTASAPLFAAALRAIFLGPPEDGCIAVPPVDAQQLYCDDAERYLLDHQAELRLATAVERIRVERVRDRLILGGVVLAGGEELQADAVIAAIPAAAVLSLIDEGLREGESYFAALGRLRTTPVTTVHLRLDTDVDVAGEDAVALLGSPFHLMLQRAGGVGHEVWLQAFGARGLAGRDDAALIRLGTDELRGVLATSGAAAASARVTGARVIREPDAALAHPAGGDSDRPPCRTPVEGLFLAGDYVRTGIPANLESAARSAEEAATLVLEYEPPPPPPPPRGFIPLDRLTRRPPN